MISAFRPSVFSFRDCFSAHDLPRLISFEVGTGEALPNSTIRFRGFRAVGFGEARMHQLADEVVGNQMAFGHQLADFRLVVYCGQTER